MVKDTESQSKTQWQNMVRRHANPGAWSAETIVEFVPHDKRKARPAVRCCRLVGLRWFHKIPQEEPERVTRALTRLFSCSQIPKHKLRLRKKIGPDFQFIAVSLSVTMPALKNSGGARLRGVFLIVVVRAK